MKFASLTAFAFVAGALCLPNPGVQINPRDFNVEPSCRTLACTQDAVAFAYTYGFPLYSYGILIQQKNPLGTNALFHSRTLLTAADKSVVRPNADTLYSVGFVDLSTHDLEITVPEFGDRFGDLGFYDMYANNFANIGSVANVTNGSFLLRYSKSNVGIVTATGQLGYDGCVDMPTAYGILLARIVVANTTESMNTAHTLQDKMTVTPILRAGSAVAPPLNLNMFKDPFYTAGNGTSIPELVLRITAALSPYNEPEVFSDRPRVAQELYNAGISNGTWTPPPGTNLTAAVQIANAQLAALLAKPGNVEHLTNNWTTLDSHLMGNYGSFYSARYAIAAKGYLMLTTDQASYPSFESISSIGANQAILFQFSGRPVLKEQGFWSLTVYGADQFFIPNDLDRYNLGDRSNLTFDDGSLVYGDGAADGPFEILLQPADVAAPANWTSNWLPGPSGGGELSFTLRWYGAESEMEESGSYVYPKVSIIDAITT